MVKRAAIAACLVAGCGWSLPAPDVRRDATTDAPRDAATVDLVVVVDGRSDGATSEAAVLDAARDAAVDAAADVTMDRPAGDAVVEAGADVRATDAADVAASDADGSVLPVDAGADVPVDGDVATCTPGERRSCYDGPAASRGMGDCRDGVESCTAGGTWSGACAGSLVPDCAGRVCGSDDCGGACGPPCPTGQVCDDTGQCTTPACGRVEDFTVTCTNGATCPTNALCTFDNFCGCAPGFAARTCDGTDCGTLCTAPDWYCARAGFCGGGAVTCAGGFLCPRHAACDEARRTCICNAGFVAVNCAGARCTACPGTDYRCVPAS